MFKIATSELPDTALLQRYAKDPRCYTDCFSTELPRHISLSEFVAAFYTTPLFRLERVILKYAAKRLSTDAEAEQVAAAQTDSFAAWSVEDRADDQLLMCDMHSRTRSWFMIETKPGAKTQAYFGSAVTPPKGKTDLGLAFKMLLPLHRLYSVLLLKGAAKRILSIPNPD